MVTENMIAIINSTTMKRMKTLAEHMRVLEGSRMRTGPSRRRRRRRRRMGQHGHEQAASEKKGWGPCSASG